MVRLGYSHNARMRERIKSEWSGWIGFGFSVSGFGFIRDFCVEVTFRFDIRIGHTIDGIKRETKRREREERKRRSHIQL